MPQTALTSLVCCLFFLVFGRDTVFAQAPPLPWMGYEGGGLIWVKDLPQTSDLADADEEAERYASWLGKGATLTAVDPARGFWIQTAPHAGIGKDQKGKRFHVMGAKSECEVEVVEGVRGVLWFTEQFPSEPNQPLEVTYKGKGLRLASGQRVVKGAHVLGKDDMVMETMVEPHRFHALRAKPVNGSCPLEGLVGAPGTLTRLEAKTAPAEVLKALRPLVRKNKWVARINQAYLKAKAQLSPDDLGCESKDKLPKHMDEGVYGLRAQMFKGPTGQTWALAMIGNEDNSCDYAHIGIVYSQAGESWKQARELWGDSVRPLSVLFALTQEGGGQWLMTWKDLRYRYRGWQVRITSLDKPGTGTTWGSYPDYATDGCDYTDWTQSTRCQLVFDDFED